MQSYSQKVDASLGLEDLEALGQRLDLPARWSYRAITLDTDFALEAPNGEAQTQQAWRTATLSKPCANLGAS